MQEQVLEILRWGLGLGLLRLGLVAWSTGLETAWCSQATVDLTGNLDMMLIAWNLLQGSSCGSQGVGLPYLHPDTLSLSQGPHSVSRMRQMAPSHLLQSVIRIKGRKLPQPGSAALSHFDIKSQTQSLSHGVFGNKS